MPSHGTRIPATDARAQVGPPTGIETLEADTFRLECYQTPTALILKSDPYGDFSTVIVLGR
jgi:hypothetical protein